MTQVAEVAPESVTSTTVAVPGDNHPRLRAAVVALANETRDVENNNDIFVMDLMEQILSAETVEEIFAAQDAGMMSGQDFTNRPFLLKEEDITIRPSTKKSGFPFYAQMTVTEIATGDSIPLSCGGKTFMSVMLALREKRYFQPTDAYPDGKPLVLIGTESGDGAYLSLKPYAGYKARESSPAAARAKK